MTLPKDSGRATKRLSAKVTLTFGPTDYAKGTLGAKGHWWRALVASGDLDLAEALQRVEVTMEAVPGQEYWNSKEKKA